MIALLVLLLPLATLVVATVRLVVTDGYGRRPPPASWAGEDAHRTWPR